MLFAPLLSWIYTPCFPEAFYPDIIDFYLCCSVANLCPTLCNPMDSACQASLSFTIPQSLLRFMSTE